LAFPQGINFRSTSGYVTDGADEDAETGTTANYPRTTAQGNTVGFEQASSYRADIDSARDRRLAGLAGTISNFEYRIDLPSAGSYNVRFAGGDNSGFGAGAYCDVKDTTTSLGVIVNDTPVSTGTMVDATNTEYTFAAWPGSNTAASLTFSTNICRFHIGNNSFDKLVSHIYIEAAAGVASTLSAVIGAARIASRGVGPSVQRFLFRTPVQLFGGVKAEPQLGDLTYDVVNPVLIANPLIGPPVLRRRNRRQPPYMPASGPGGPNVYQQVLTAALSFAGAAAARTFHALAGALSFVGSTTKRAATARSAALSFVGSLVTGQAFVRSLTGALSFAGSLVSGSVFMKALTAALSFSGAQVRMVGKALSGALSFAGAIVRRIGHVQASALSFAGALVRRTATARAGALSFAGSLVTGQAYLRSLTAALSFAGAIAHEFPVHARRRRHARLRGDRARLSEHRRLDAQVLPHAALQHARAGADRHHRDRERRRQLPGAGLAGHHRAWAAGAYGWSRTVEKTGARQTLASSEDQGEVLVRQNPATAAQGYDSRSHNRIVLEAIEACIQNRASTTQREMIEYTIGARGQKFDPADSRAALLELHSKYKWLVANEDAREAIAAGQPNPRTSASGSREALMLNSLRQRLARLIAPKTRPVATRMYANARPTRLSGTSAQLERGPGVRHEPAQPALLLAPAHARRLVRQAREGGGGEQRHRLRHRPAEPGEDHARRLHRTVNKSIEAPSRSGAAPRTATPAAGCTSTISSAR
jgi:hypothetical protein